MRTFRAMITTILILASFGALAGAAEEPAVPNGDFEATRPWERWTLTPAEPRESGLSEWERLSFEFTAPSSGRATVVLSMEGSGFIEFDALELFALAPRSAPTLDRKALRNPSFEEAVEGNAVLPSEWELSGGAARATGAAAVEGTAWLRMNLAKRGRAEARQVLALEGGRRYLLVARARGEVLAGQSAVTVVAAEPLGSARLTGSTLAGGRGLCGRLTAARGGLREASLEMPAEPGRNYTFSVLTRGEMGDRAAFKAEVYALDEAGGATLLAAVGPPSGLFGADWRPLRVNFPLRDARRLRLTFRLDGPGSLEFDDLKLIAPRAVPAPRRLASGDAADNFRPKGRRPLFTSKGKDDAEMARVFASLVGGNVARPSSFWQFWKSSGGFEHQPGTFAAALAAGLEPGAAYLLDASGEAEAKWLTERAISVPDRPGAYAVAVNAKEIVVAARSREGFAAAASALMWLTSDGPEPEVFAGHIEDWPERPLRAAAMSFDGRLEGADRDLLTGLGAYRLSHLLVTGPGFWKLSDKRARADAKELAELVRAQGLSSPVPFLDALGAAPALVERCPQAAEASWQQGESHYLRGTERSFLAVPGAVISAGAPLEVAGDDGTIFEAGRDYVMELGAAKPDSGPVSAPAVRASLRRIVSGRIADGGHVTVNYNALPAGEVPSACPRSEEALAAFREALAESVRVTGGSAVGLGGSLPVRMRTDRRTAGTRFKNGRLVADRVRDLSVEARKAAPDCGLYLWADMINPFGGLKMPEDPPTASAELLEPELRGKMTLIVRIGECDEDARGMMNASATSLPARGYRVAGWADGRGAAARAWAAAFRAAAEGAKAVPAGDKAPEAPAGLVLDLRSARTLDLEAFAEAAWNGAPAPGAVPPPAK